MVKPLPLIAIVALELDAIQREKAAAEWDAKRAFRSELRKAMRNELDRIPCLSSMSVLTQTLLSKGQAIYERIEASR